MPIIILSDTFEEDINNMVRLGVDMCISGKWPYSVIADIAYAQLRRYTEYNHYINPIGVETSSFQAGDIFIGPARRIAEVRGQSVNLRPSEFSLLLYFMRNPNIVLTSEQICEHAWGWRVVIIKAFPVLLLSSEKPSSRINPTRAISKRFLVLVIALPRTMTKLAMIVGILLGVL